MGTLSNMKHKNLFIALLIVIALLAGVMGAKATSKDGSFDCGDTYYQDPYCHGVLFDEHLPAMPSGETVKLYACYRADCLVVYEAVTNIAIMGYVYGLDSNGNIEQWVVVWNGDYDLYTPMRNVRIIYSNGIY